MRLAAPVTSTVLPASSLLSALPSSLLAEPAELCSALAEEWHQVWLAVVPTLSLCRTPDAAGFGRTGSCTPALREDVLPVLSS